MSKRKNAVLVGAALTAALTLGACSSGIRPKSAPNVEAPDLSVQATTTSHRVSGSTNDVEEWSPNNYRTDSPVLELGRRIDGTAQTMGLRFTGVAIPNKAKITGAYIEFTAATNSSGTASINIAGNAADNAAAFTGGYGSIAARPKTSARATWPASTWTANGKYNSASLVTIVQEIVNRTGWKSGAAMAFIVSGTGTRKADSYDGNAAQAPRLVVTYDPPAPPTTFESCLSGGYSARLTPSGTQENYVLNDKTNATGRIQVSAGGATFVSGGRGDSGGPRPPFAVESGNSFSSLCLSGGVYDTQVGDRAPWRPDYINGAGIILVDAPNTTVEGVTIKVAGDALAFFPGSTNWTLRDSYIRHAGDDFVENDNMYNGLIDDVLVDWAYTGISCTSSDAAQDPPGTITIRDSLIALKKQVGVFAPEGEEPDPDETPAHFRLFKYQDMGECPLKLQNVVFYVVSAEDYSFIEPYLAQCENVTLVYPSADTYPETESLPPCFNVRTGAAGKAWWQGQREAWFKRHEGHPSYAKFAPYRGNANEPQGEP